MSMIKLLKRIVEWLEIRFPSKVVVTEKLFNELLDIVHNNYRQRLEAIESNSIVIDNDLKALKGQIVNSKNDVQQQRLIANSLDDKIKILIDTIATIDKSIAALKEGIVKGEIRPALTERERERQDFINGQMPRNMPSRRELEAAERK